MRITALLRKIHELASQAEHATAIDVDLMLDYTRVLYSDLLEWRSEVQTPQLPVPEPELVIPPQPQAIVPAAAPVPPPPPVRTEPEEPTLEEYMAAHAGLAIHREPAAHETPVLEAVREPEADAPGIPNPAPPAVPEPEIVPEPVAVPEPAIVPEPVTSPTPPARPSRDIRGMIGINDKYQIMSELFGNDKAAYEQALDVINRAESEQAAFNWLRERLWVTEDHSDAAMIFFDVVRRFKNS